jgi:hypothetical protein
MSRAYLALYLLSLVVRRRNDRIVDSREFIDRNELELALEQLEALGALNNCRGGFWRELERAAVLMGLDAQAQALNRKFHEALVRVGSP